MNNSNLASSQNEPSFPIKINFENITSFINGDTQKESFIHYLKDIWYDLSQRSFGSVHLGISKHTFASYYNLPGIISDRLFNLLDNNNSSMLECKEFVNGMTILFSGDFNSSSKLIFNFYDYDKDGFILKEEIRTVLSYVTLANDYQNFSQRVKSQKELYDIIEKCFSQNQRDVMDYTSFKYSIENISSDIYLIILLFLHEKKPFTKSSILNYNKTPKSPEPNKPDKFISPIRSPVKKNTLIASPTKDASFSPYSIFKRRKHKRTATTITKPFLECSEKILLGQSPSKKEKQKSEISGIKSNNIIELKSLQNANSNKKNEATRNKSSIKDDNKHGNTIISSFVASPHKKNNKIYLNCIDKDEIRSIQNNKGVYTQNNIRNCEISPTCKNNKAKININYESEDELALSSPTKKDGNDDVNRHDLSFKSNSDSSEPPSFTEDSSSIITTSGYIYKYTNSKLKKVFFKLVNKDLFYFKSDKDEMHKGLHNLSGVFLKEEPIKEINNFNFYCFSIQYPKKKCYYYLLEEIEYKTWIEKLKIVTAYINLDDMYEMKQELGSGKFGLIKLAINKQTKQKVAIKIMTKKTMSPEDLEFVKTEIDVLRVCNHPNIIKLYDVFENADYYYIVMEYCEGGDFFTYLEKRKFRLSESRAAKIMHKMFTAVYFIHSYGIAHRDLKPENVLMTSDGNDADIKILDFGLSKIICPQEKCNEPYGTLSYVAPEILLDEPYGKEVDLWSLGIITYLILCGTLPFDHKYSEEEIAKKTVNENPPYRGSIWTKISAEAKDFVGKLLEKDPQKRMTIKEALEHEWFQKYVGKIVYERQRSKDVPALNFELYSTTGEITHV